MGHYTNKVGRSEILSHGLLICFHAKIKSSVQFFLFQDKISTFKWKTTVMIFDVPSASFLLTQKCGGSDNNMRHWCVICLTSESCVCKVSACRVSGFRGKICEGQLKRDRSWEVDCHGLPACKYVEYFLWRKRAITIQPSTMLLPCLNAFLCRYVFFLVSSQIPVVEKLGR